MNYYSILKPILFLLNPETAHKIAVKAIQLDLAPKPKTKEYFSLKTKVFGIDFSNPIGMAAGFDKNAEIFANLFDYGFGFVESGTVTPIAQIGNPKPRIFRLEEDRAIINRLGFNNQGSKTVLENIIHHQTNLGKKPIKGVFGINFGKNKDTKQALDDYLPLIEKFYGLTSYITINISSPNTKNLRNLQKAKELDMFLLAIQKKKQEMEQLKKIKVPILIKIAPDLEESEQEDIGELSLKHQIDGLIISNTTVKRQKNLQSQYRNEIGGLSGKPLFESSNQVLSNIYKLTKGNIPLIGVGGISSAKDVYQKFQCGASLVQIYSGLIYEGFGLIEEIKKQLDEMLKADGLKNISELTGTIKKLC